MTMKALTLIIIALIQQAAEAKLYLVELKTSGTAQGSVYYRDQLELPRGLSQVIGEDSSRRDQTVLWEENHLAIVDSDDIDAEDWGWSGKLLTKPEEILKISFQLTLHQTRHHFELSGGAPSMRIYPAKEKYGRPYLDLPSWRKILAGQQIPHQNAASLKILVKTNQRVRNVVIKGNRALDTLLLDWREMMPCESSLGGKT